LTRENRELDNFANLLESKNIQYQIKENKSIFDIKSSLLVYFYLKALENHYLHADKLFGILLSEPFAFNTADYNYLLEQNRLNHKDFIFNIRENMQSYKWENPGKVKKFLSTYNKLCRLKNNINLKQLIINVINETGILDYFVQSDINKSENIYAIKKIIQEAASYIYIHKDALLNDFLNYIDYAFESGIPILTDKDEYTQNAVQLLTMHGSKGREFEYVFIPNLISKKWENKRVNNTMSLPIIKNNDKAEETAEIKSEQLRLLFVGITRAKHSLYLSFSNSIDGKPQELTSYLSEAVKNENIVATYNQELSKDDYLNELVFSLKKNHYDYKSAFKCELEARIANFILSPSTLNQYENCPQSFLYNSVLKIPILDKPTDNANYGRAIHAALQFCANYARANDVYPDKNLLIDSFIKNLSKEKFESEEDRLKYQTRGIESLSKYHIQFVQTPINRIYSTEYKLDFVPFKNHFIKGFVDRIERNQDGSFELYDYKTGGAKSKSQIADGKEYEGYLNQLRFYKYAFEIKNPEAVVSKAGLIFVEEPHANFYVNLTYEDNKIIENKILNAYENISALNFDPPSPLERKCEYCDYKHLCRLCEL
ncbi:MAG: PD-(D/E)XK nuclease family protein, partial [Candidatus Gastranaerophilales bacterium]|nr:PD-(D/E)XK nuclease family protein [Candidatus Gastranaerophilales bacterium]